MSVDVIMPQLGETVAEGTVSRWLFEEGSTVTADEPLLEVSTDKVDTEVVAPVSGVLERIMVPEGETVSVGTVLAQLGPGGLPPSSTSPSAASDGSEGLPDTDLTEPRPAASQQASAGTGAPSAALSDSSDGLPDTDLTEPRPAAAQQASARIAAPPASGRPHRHRDSPRVRRAAREHGVDLATSERSGLNGRATLDDVQAAARRQDHGAPKTAAMPEPPSTAGAAPPPSPPRGAEPTVQGRVERLSRRRKVIADRMHQSLLTTAQLTTVVEVDLTRVVRVREAAKDAFRSRHDAPLTVLAFVAEAAMRSIAEHPVINAALNLDEGTVTYPPAVDLGVAVDTEDGLIVPVVPGADDLTVGALARRIADIATRARAGSITADDLAGGSFTITNTGSRGALFDTPILNRPQSAILGLGAVVRRPVALIGEDGDELVTVRAMAYMSLTYDHRLVDGADAARFLSSLKTRLESREHRWSDIPNGHGEGQ